MNECNDNGREITNATTQPPRVLIGSPVYSNKKYITPHWIESVKSLTYSNYDLLVVDNSKPDYRFQQLFDKAEIPVLTSEHYEHPFRRVAEARQKLNDYAVQKKYDYLLSIEQDVIVPTDIVEKLLAHAKHIVGAPYIVSSFTDSQRRHLDYVVSASKLDKVLGREDFVDINEWYITEEIAGKGLIQVKSCSLGCTLIATPILQKIPVRYNPDINRADDSYFFQDCQDKGIPVFLDASLLWAIQHIKRLGGELQVGLSLNKNGNRK